MKQVNIISNFFYYFITDCENVGYIELYNGIY